MIFRVNPNCKAPAGFEVLTAVTINSTVMWDLMPRNAVEVQRSFGGKCYLHLQDRRVSQPTSKNKAASTAPHYADLSAIISFLSFKQILSSAPSSTLTICSFL
jgi:hypothetical protein